MARNASSPTTRIVRPKSLTLRLMPRRSASACGRAWSRRISPASGSCWNCSSTASSSPTKRWRSVTSSPSDRGVSATRFVYCEQTIKHVFQLHGVDAHGRAVVCKRVSRAKLAETVVQLAPKVAAMEACCGAHYWGRRFRDLGLEVRLIHAKFARPFVKGAKNDARDAEAICEAALRPSM